MGNSNSRPKICQVAPSLDQPMEDEPSLLPTSPWMITAVKGTERQEKGIVGQRKTNHLPPLTGRHEVPHIVCLEPGSQSVCDKSIIKSHPPQPAKGWHTMALATGADVNPAKHARMACKTEEFEDTGWRDGPVHCYSTPSLGGRCGTSNTLQGHMKGVLPAQTMLSRQATKKRQAQQRCFRERWGKSKRGYASYVEGEEMERSQRVQLVSRSMQQNVFWDEFEGRILDVRELLQPSPQLTDPNVGDMSGKPLANGIRPEVEDQKCEGLRKESHHKDPYSPKSITNLDPQLIETVQRFCNTNMKLP
ncbi:uncharacterized protein LOC130080314 isoform X2 [Rhinichthys klamathensis goyatoka]|uniref:uncharacterized protein LOC130080314 isoform X2 n=1 Tax=Rhinichthys klamathensis goyatoka TaxID=3034132 RepID=UPI0024B5B68D|nr:uncharacterized protein LOC130080314 isoform X2 [Rhinichthys klamathensis goyatoka]